MIKFVSGSRRYADVLITPTGPGDFEFINANSDINVTDYCADAQCQSHCKR